MPKPLERPATEAPTCSRGTRALLIGAPLLMAVARVLLVPLDDQDWDGTMTKMVSHAARSNIGWFLALASCGLLAVTGVVLAQQLRTVGRPKSAMFAMLAIA